MTWTASVAALRAGREPFKYGYFPDAANPYDSDATFMHRRRAILLGIASGEVREGRLDPNSGVGRLAYVVESVKSDYSLAVALSADGRPLSQSEYLADTLGVGQHESTVILAVLASIDLGWEPLLRHDRGDPLNLVNQFLLVMEPWKVGEGDGAQGNYDFLLGNFVTVATTYGHLLSGEARDHLVNSLLTERGPTDYAQLIVRHGPFGVVSYDETENHILQIEIARYLTNELIGFDNKAAGVTSFLLGRLQGFLQNDFSEYNSRPYQGHSVRAITALFDLAREASVRAAAQLVLDYLAVKFAVSSNGLRRYTPFRRRREHTWEPSLFDDSESKRFLAVTGMGRLFREASLGSDLKLIEPFTAVPAVLTKYRPPLVARDLIMTNRHKRYYQRFRHSGLELFHSTPAFLVTAGGIRVGSALGMDKVHLEDISVPLATTLMPSEHGVDVGDIIRLTGNDTDEWKVNTGVVPGFACGLNARVPAKYEPISDPRPEDGGLAVFNATKLQDPEGYYVGISLKTWWAQAAGEGVWLVVVPAIDMDFDRFRANVLNGVGASDAMDTTGLNRVDVAPVGPVAFTPAGDRENLFRWPIRGLEGQWYDCSTWPLAEGDVMNSEGHTGVVHVDHPILPLMTADERRALRIAPLISVRRQASKRGIETSAGLRRTMRDLETQGIRAGGSVRRAFEILSRRLTLDFRDVNHPIRIEPLFTAREVALLLGRGLTADIRIKKEAARKQLDVTGGLRAALAELRGRGIHTSGSVTRAFELLAERPSPTGEVSIRKCFNYHRVTRTTEFRLSTLLRGG